MGAFPGREKEPSPKVLVLRCVLGSLHGCSPQGLPQQIQPHLGPLWPFSQAPI